MIEDGEVLDKKQFGVFVQAFGEKAILLIQKLSMKVEDVIRMLLKGQRMWLIL